MKDREPHVGGVPARVFQPGFNDVVSGLSGKTSLLCNMHRDSLEIEDQADSALHFRMRYWPRDEAVAMSIRTKLQNQRHPDLFAAKLVKQGITYLQEQGLPVKQIRGEFRPHTGNDNYERYTAYLNELMELKGAQGITEKDRREAAKQSWTAKVAESLDFPKLRSLEITDRNEIIVFFVKNQT
jgi:hypothetical protein